jgi:hypothetical protein
MTSTNADARINQNDLFMTLVRPYITNIITIT